MNMRPFLRMAKWARIPPSESRVKMVFGILVACLLLYAIERWIGWPAFLTTGN